MTATDGAPEHGSRVPGALAAATPGMRWRRVFPGEERQLGVLRRWLASLLPECPQRDDVACVATELGGNAVRHTSSGQGGWFAVEITWHQPAVRVAVADCGAPDGPRVIDDPEGEHGRGLLVVRGLSVRTGVCGDHRGRLVWADIRWDDAGAAGPAAPMDPYEAAIGAGQADLVSRFTGVPAWFGRSTLQWWALAGGELVAAPSAQELASLLGRVLDPRPRFPPGHVLDPASARRLLPLARSCVELRFRDGGASPGGQEAGPGSADPAPAQQVRDQSQAPACRFAL
jgi:anti-sigma regulatory factor (Ser/Thr protein kinase)